MELILASEKDFENIALRHDPVYAGVETIVDALLEFIKKHELCIYGGLAIDYALRRFGDKLYPDDLLQIDYDFMSPDHIEHAYDLADMFYKMILASHGADEAEGVRTINALHVKTMRVDIRDNHFLADVTFCPASIFPLLPTLTYKGVKIIHPDMQRIDIHSSLSFPYDYPPTEVIFARWKKDITRFKMIAKYYPIEKKANAVGGARGVGKAQNANSAATVQANSAATVQTNSAATVQTNITTHLGTIIAPAEINKYVLTGFPAYGIMYSVIAQKYGKIPEDIITPTNFQSGNTVNAKNIQLYGSTLEIAHFNPDKCIEELSLAHVHRYHPVINMIPATVTGMASFGKVKIDVTTGRLLSSVSATINGKIYRLACAQYLLRQFLSEYHYARMRSDPIADIYLDHYVSLMMLMEFENTKTSIPADATDVTTDTAGIVAETTTDTTIDAADVTIGTDTTETAAITRLSITTYGDENTSLSKEVALRRTLVDIGKAVSDYLPNNYYPARRGENSTRPQYDIKRNSIFLEAGEEIIKDSLEDQDRKKVE
jgi:Poly(A) polymerase catalytic subunit